jgi:hypothetical protein
MAHREQGDGEFELRHREGGPACRSAQITPAPDADTDASTQQSWLAAEDIPRAPRGLKANAVLAARQQYTQRSTRCQLAAAQRGGPRASSTSSGKVSAMASH